MKHRLFVYGTLQLPERVNDVIGRSLSGVPAVLPGYRCGLVARADFPGIVVGAGATTQGQLLSGLTLAELKALDQYEGELYQRVKVDVQCEHIKRNAWVYTISAWARERITAQQWTIAWYRNRISQKRITY